MKTKVCYIMSFIEFSQQFIDIDEATDSSKYELTYIFLSPQIPALQKSLEARGRTVRFIEYKSKKELFRAIAEVYKYLKELAPHIVHTHLSDGSLAGLIGARLRNIRKAVHTRHHSVENHVYHPHGIYYDKIINRLSKKIIAISNLVANILIEKENVKAQKVQVIEHGFNFDNYTFSTKGIAEMKAKYDISENSPIVGVVSRFVHWKGVQFIIPAFKKLTSKYPGAKLVLANGRGDYRDEIERILRENLQESQYVLIEFEKNFIELYKMFDVFVHTPINDEFEAFGQTYIESLALGIPSVFTLSGIANDFIVDRRNALVIPHQDSESLFEALDLLLKDGKLREKLILQGKSDVCERFNIQRMIKQMDDLYQSL